MSLVSSRAPPKPLPPVDHVINLTLIVYDSLSRADYYGTAWGLTLRKPESIVLPNALANRVTVR